MVKPFRVNCAVLASICLRTRVNRVCCLTELIGSEVLVCFRIHVVQTCCSCTHDTTRNRTTCEGERRLFQKVEYNVLHGFTVGHSAILVGIVLADIFCFIAENQRVCCRISQCGEYFLAAFRCRLLCHSLDDLAHVVRRNFHIFERIQTFPRNFLRQILECCVCRRINCRTSRRNIVIMVKVNKLSCSCRTRHHGKAADFSKTDCACDCTVCRTVKHTHAGISKESCDFLALCADAVLFAACCVLYPSSDAGLRILRSICSLVKAIVQLLACSELVCRSCETLNARTHVVDYMACRTCQRMLISICACFGVSVTLLVRHVLIT